MKPRRTLTLSLALFLFAVPAFAQPPKPTAGDAAAAQGLFYEARTLMQQQRYTEACAKLEESDRLDHGIGTQFNLADCHEHIGKVATAWAGFIDVAAQAKVAAQPDRERVAKKRAQALEPRLPKLVIEVPEAPRGLEVRRDGVLVGNPQWNTAVPLDPGPHKIVASAPGKQSWETTVTAVEGKAAKVAVPRSLPDVVVTTAAPLAEPRPAEPLAFSPTYRDDGDSDRGSAQRTAGWIIGGAGVAALAVGAGFGIASMQARSESRDRCRGDACDLEGVALRDDAIQRGNIATVVSISGGAAVLGGLLLVLTSPRGSDRTRGAAIQPVPNVATSGGGLLLQGRF